MGGLPEVMNNWQLNSVHLFRECDRCFAFDGNSMGMAEIPAELFHILYEIRKGPNDRAVAKLSSSLAPSRVDSMVSIGEQLFKAGFFRWTPRSCDPPSMEQIERTGISEVYLSLTEACNLACRYCFVEATGQKQGSSFLSKSVAKQSIDFAVAHAIAGKPLSVVLWGGEPLLNPGLVRFVVSYGHASAKKRDLDILFATTTNCTRLTEEMCELLTSNKVIVNFSIDGGPASHDLNRVFRRGVGSYGTVASNVQRFLIACRRNFPEFVPRARVTVTHATVSSFMENHLSIWNLGVPLVWNKDVDWLPADHPLSLTSQDYGELTRQYALLRDYIMHELNSANARLLYPQIWFDLHQIHQRQRTFFACGGGFTGISVNPRGEIHACYHLANRPEPFRLGSVFESSLDVQRRVPFSRRHVDQITPCSDCSFKYLCGGGCFAKSVFHDGDFRDCWPGQCRFIESYYDHCLRLYGRLMASPHRERIRKLLDTTEAGLDKTEGENTLRE
jgi:uncharacterized protein